MRIDSENYALNWDVRDDGFHLVMSFKRKDDYNCMKSNNWKQFNFANYQILENFKGYSDSHMAMKFVLVGDNIEDQLNLLETMISNELTGNWYS